MGEHAAALAYSVIRDGVQTAIQRVMKAIASSRFRSTRGEANLTEIRSTLIPGKCLKSVSSNHLRRRRQLSPKQGNIRLSHILVAVDFSDESEKAVRYAACFAAEFGAEITLLHVVEPITCQADYGYGPVLRQVPDLATAGCSRKKLARLVRKLEASGCEVDAVVRNGNAHDEIVRVARDQAVDLIILGTRVNTDSERKGQGSTAEHVLRQAPCPVFVVRKKEHDFVSSKKLR